MIDRLEKIERDVETIKQILPTLATKEDLKAFATKEDLKAFATKEDLKAFATKEDLKAYATKEDLREESERTRRELRMLIEHHDDQIRVIAEGHVWLAERLEACRRHREDAQRVRDARVTRLESRQ